MGGAEAVDLSQLKGKMLINIDSEEEGILTTGCAGGIFYKTVIPMKKDAAEGSLVRSGFTDSWADIPEMRSISREEMPIR